MSAADRDALLGALRLWRGGRRRELLHLLLPVVVLLLALFPLRVRPRHTATMAPALFVLAALALPWRRTAGGAKKKRDAEASR